MKAALVLLALSCGFASMAGAQVPLPGLEARVTDLTGTLTAAQQSALEEKLAAFEIRKGSQIAVLILPTTEPEDIAQFSIRLADAWKIGREGPDDGAILVVAKDDRTLRIEVGRGLEGALTDVTASRIINDTMAPLFKQGDFNGGVNAGLDQLIRVIDGEPLPEPDQRWKRDGGGKVPWVALLFVALAFTEILKPFVGRGPAALIGAGGGGAVVYWLTARVFEAVGVGVGILLLGLFLHLGRGMDFGGGSGRVYRDSRRGGGLGGLGGGFGGGFGRGGGGFRGGGGSFGGGGASGRW